MVSYLVCLLDTPLGLSKALLTIGHNQRPGLMLGILILANQSGLWTVDLAFYLSDW